MISIGAIIALAALSPSAQGLGENAVACFLGVYKLDHSGVPGIEKVG